MKTKLASAIGVLFCIGLPGFAHRLDEYLQAAMISISKERVQVAMRLVPGVAVLPTILANIDTNRDGVISIAERRTYARQVLRDLSLTIDGHALQPKLVSFGFPTLDDMKQGLGEIHIEFTADLPRGGDNRKIILQNRHQSRIAAYLVNCLVPRDPDIHVLAQHRNQNQSVYELDYAQVDVASGALASRWWSLRTSLGNLGGFVSMFRLGMRHIAEGTDHLLFLLALLLPAPLFAFGSRWDGFASLRHGVRQILRVVTAFTVGHSITLALAGLGVVLLPSRPIEVLIAVSILVSSIHALRPIFPGREPVIAACFGLVHGLAFAATLGLLGLGMWARLANIFAFNVGIEAMQLIVVAAAMPSLVLLSRTRAYPLLRVGGALFSGGVSIGWIAERLLNLPGLVDDVVDGIAHQAVWIAGVLFVVSIVFWSVGKLNRKQSNILKQLPGQPIEVSVQPF
ncbi:MAG TPA: HupE/UreJ family protein [Bryobacteraceae bacterium]|nr:HupE/UreJ family protein [Bryobacteraceae bacterium]